MNLPLVILIALTTLWMAATAAGITLIMLGLRGRRADFLRRCRTCRYVIASGFDSSTCSECGMDIRESGTIRVGRRRVSEPKLVFGLILLLCSATPVVLLMTNGTTATTVAPGVAGPVMNAQPLRRRPVTTAALLPPMEWASDESATSQAVAGRSDDVNSNASSVSLLERAGLHLALEASDMPVDDVTLPAIAAESVVVIAEPEQFSTQVDLNQSMAWQPGRRQTGKPDAERIGVLFDIAPLRSGWSSAFDLGIADTGLLESPAGSALIGPAVRYDAPTAMATPWSVDTAGSGNTQNTRVESAALKATRIGQPAR